MEKTDSLAWKLEYEQDEQAQHKLMTTSYHPSSSQAFKPALGATVSSPGKQQKLTFLYFIYVCNVSFIGTVLYVQIIYHSV